MAKRDDFILKTLHVLSWIVFTGLCVEAGALIFNFIFSLFNPLATHNIYRGLNLSALCENRFEHYIGVMSFVLILSVLKAYLFYLVVKIFMKLNLVKPFHIDIARLVEKISLQISAIAVIGIIAQQYSKRLVQHGYELGHMENFWDDTVAFLMMAAIVFIISQIFKKGIELQNESDLTV